MRAHSLVTISVRRSLFSGQTQRLCVTDSTTRKLRPHDGAPSLIDTKFKIHFRVMEHNHVTVIAPVPPLCQRLWSPCGSAPGLRPRA